MATSAPRKRRARGSISPEQILAGAFEIAGRDGLDEFSMPNLAAHLDVGVTSIYWYFRNKEELLRQMSAKANVKIEAKGPTPSDYNPSEWRHFLADSARFRRSVSAGDDLVVDLVYLRTGSYTRTTTHAVYGGLENILAFLVEAGFSLRSAWMVFSTLSVYLRGLLIAERVRRTNQTPPEGLPQLNLLDEEKMPLLTELVRTEPVIIDNTGEAAFEFALAHILDQAEVLLEKERATRSE
jgi:AcrR family transcriptional regulator